MLAVALLLTILALLPRAWAHAALTSTDPIDGAVVASTPGRMLLSFNEPVSPLALKLIGPDGATVALDSFVVRDRTVEIEGPTKLGEGTHVLTWRVVSEDGHPVGGSLVFSVGRPSATPPPVADTADPMVRILLWSARVALYVGLFFGIGGACAGAWLTPVSRSGTSIAALAGAVGLAGTAVSPGLQGLDAMGATMAHLFDPLIWHTGMATSFGRTVLAMLVALILSMASLRTGTAMARALSVIALLMGAGALALSGHASAAQPQWLMRPAVFAHAASVVFWIGALPTLALALHNATADATMALRRFSRAIVFAVGLLVASGLVLAAVQVQQPAALLDTAYGRLLLAKLALLALLFLLAAINRWRLTGSSGSHDGRARRLLVRSIMAETVLVIAIMGVVAGWRFTPPPRALAIAAAMPADMHIHTDKAMADVTLTPGRIGPVEISAVIMTGDFGPLDAKEVTFVLSNPSAGIEPLRRKAKKPGDGTWRADAVIPLPGKWTLRIDILISDFDLVRIEGDVDIRP